MNDVHVMPDFGKQHVMRPTCWCRPTKDPRVLRVQPSGPHLWVHGLAH